ncbi:winged helix-turn-helix domain-containing protein [Kitasatospora sp. NPDC090091]|uniref:winged helix-turn-helix domain-containing protein n=1 Tax=Kitasatospora sp. NPDC090091 TaxID=3364081 RepID=UPI0038304DAA
MLRVHFTADDLCSVTLISRLPQLGEAVLSVQALRRNDQRLRFDAWRRSLRGNLPAQVGPLLDLVPAHGWIPDFLTSTRDNGSVRDVLEAVRAVPRRQLTADLNRLASAHALPGWVRGLADGDRDAMNALTRALAAYHDLAIAPHVRRMQSAVDVDLDRRVTTLRRHGVGALLSGLHPALRWQPPVLTVPSPFSQDVHLAGRGMTVAPVVFGGPLPRLLLGDRDDRPVLIYPLAFDAAANPLVGHASDARRQRAAKALGTVLGATRSAVLHAVAAAPGLSTSELARRVCVSTASASEHATSLREAGLIASCRERNRVLHYPTAAAAVLLNAPHTVPSQAAPAGPQPRLGGSRRAGGRPRTDPQDRP